MTEQHRLELRPITAAETDQAVGVLSRGMLDNPGHLAAFGSDPERRQARLARMFGGLFAVIDDRPKVGVFEGDRMVGFASGSTPGRCRLGPLQQARAGLAMIGNGPASLVRVLRWQGTWAGQDPDRPHHHFGPIAVDAGRQGQGIGSLLMTAFTEQWDRAGEAAYLETDKPENLAFYRRHGFEVITEGPVLGRPNWFLWRDPRS